MVGIPGKSQGCHTCRRRKIKCDQIKPACKNCIKSGRQCEGYAKGPVFLNRTAEGLMKRGRLEEILPSTDPGQMIPSQLSPGRNDSSLPEHLRQSDQVRHHLEALFLEYFLAKDNTPEWPSPCSYVWAVMEMPRDWIVEPALQALCTTRIGRLYNNTDMIEQGSQTYILALQRLHFAVSDPETRLSDSTFAATKILNLHELYEPTTGCVKGIYGHAAGLSTLMQLRGPANHTSKVAKLLLEASRYNAMISCIQSWNQSSPLATPEWRTTSWNTIGNFEQGLYDIGFDIANFLEDVNLFTIHPPVNFNDTSNQSLAQKSIALCKDLSVWYERCIAWAPSPVYWSKETVERASHHGFEFHHITLAHLLMDYWAIQLALYVVMEKLSTGLKCHKPQDTTKKDSPDVKALHDFVIEHGREAQWKLAENITNSMSYCCRPEMGWSGPQRTVFPVRCALAFYRRSIGNDARHREAETAKVMEDLGEKNGLLFARSLTQRAPPKWALAAPMKDPAEAKEVDDQKGVGLGALHAAPLHRDDSSTAQQTD